MKNKVSQKAWENYAETEAEYNFQENMYQRTIELSREIFSGRLTAKALRENIGIIQGPNGSFNKLLNSSFINNTNRLSFCKDFFDYCEMSQDWKSVGSLLSREISDLKNELVSASKEEESWLYFAYGRYLEETGQLEQSLDYHRKGIALCKEIKHTTNLALNSLGAGISLQRYSSQEDIETALPYLKYAVEVFNSTNKYQQANSLMNLGSCYDRLEQGNRSIQAYISCIEILERLNNRFDLGRAYYSLGMAYINCKQLGKAKKSFIEGQSCCEESSNAYYLSLIHYGYGLLAYRERRYRASQEILKKSIHGFNQYLEDYTVATKTSFYEIEGNLYLLAAASHCGFVA